MYVFCVGMYRSCSTWQYQIASQLVESRYGGTRQGFIFGHQFEERDKTPIEPAWQVVKSHEGHPAFARALAEGRALGFYSYRDLRDVAFSLAHKFDLAFADVLFKERLLENCLESDKFWTGQLNVLCQRYEEIIAKPVQAILAIAEHLQIPLDEKEATLLADEYSFEANLERTKAVRERLSAQGVNLAKHENALANDQHSLLHWNHLRSGGEGGWRLEANQLERAELDKICGDWLIARAYEHDHSWVEVQMDAVWNQFDHVRGELAAARRHALELENYRVELAKSQDQLAHTQQELSRARTALDQAEMQIISERQQLESHRLEVAARISEQANRLTEATNRLAQQEQRLAEAAERMTQQDSLMEQLRTRVAELESLGPETLKLAGHWRRLADQHPRACSSLRPVARRVIRLLAS